MIKLAIGIIGLWIGIMIRQAEVDKLQAQIRVLQRELSERGM